MHKRKGSFCPHCKVPVKKGQRTFKAFAQKEAKTTPWPVEGATHWREELKAPSAFLYDQMPPDAQQKAFQLSIRFWQADESDEEDPFAGRVVVAQGIVDEDCATSPEQRGLITFLFTLLHDKYVRADAMRSTPEVDSYWGYLHAAKNDHSLLHMSLHALATGSGVVPEVPIYSSKTNMGSEKRRQCREIM